jgi:hypothetical protein
MAYRLLILLLLLGACSPAQKTVAVSQHAQDTSYAYRVDLTKQWLNRIGLMDQFKLFFQQSMESDLNSLEAVTEEAETAKAKVTPLLGEEFDRLLPEAIEILAAPFAHTFSAAELLECVNSSEKLPSTGPLREKFDANEASLKNAFETAGIQIGMRVWTNALNRLSAAEQKALEQGLSKPSNLDKREGQ